MSVAGTEIQSGGHTYRLGQLDARKQVHCFRRIAPLLAAAAGLLPTLLAAIPARPGADPGSNAERDDESASRTALAVTGAILPVLGPLMDALSKMPDEEANYVMDACLGVVFRQMDGGTGWAPVAPGGVVMFADIGPTLQLELTGRVLLGAPGSGGLADFFGERLSALRSQAAPPA